MTGAQLIKKYKKNLSKGSEKRRIEYYMAIVCNQDKYTNTYQQFSKKCKSFKREWVKAKSWHKIESLPELTNEKEKLMALMMKYKYRSI